MSRNNRPFGISRLGLPTKGCSPPAFLIRSFGCSAFLPVHKVVCYRCDLSQSSYLLFQPLWSSSQLKLNKPLVLFHQIIPGWKEGLPTTAWMQTVEPRRSSCREAPCGIIFTIRHARYVSVDDSHKPTDIL